MHPPELLEALHAMRQLGETLSQTARDYHRVLVELEDVREGMATLDGKIAAVERAAFEARMAALRAALPLPPKS